MINIEEMANELLAVNVVVYRTLHINKELAVQSMIELTKRRERGDSFNYEEFIENKIKEMPKVDDKQLKSIASSINLFKMLIK